jgi:tRNA threonylcarbamoyladenosine biosynthesis protein TsaB
MTIAAALSGLRLPLLVDASSQVQIGIADTKDWLSLVKEEAPALESLFMAIPRSLGEIEASISAIDAILFCEGPGSTLGLRVAATAVKTILRENEPSPTLFTYNALDLAAIMSNDFSRPILAPFRKGKRLLRSPISGSAIGSIEVLEEPISESLSKEALHLPSLRSRERLPEGLDVIDYDISHIAGLEGIAPILRLAEMPEVFTPLPTEFRKWEPARNLSPN